MADLTHNQYDLSSGISMHVADQGEGMPVILCHGFPELWYSWRNQISVVADAGFRAKTSAATVHELSARDRGLHAREDLRRPAGAARRDRRRESDLGRSRLGWRRRLEHGAALPQRTHAVAGINTPFSPNAPVDPQTAMEADPGRFDYQIYFQDEGAAEAELAADVARTFKLLFRGSSAEDRLDGIGGTAGVRERGGLFVGAPQDPARSAMLDQEELNYFVDQFSKTGFRGGLNSYRKHRRNWEWGKETAGQKVEAPAVNGDRR